jgi:hypothetical protein
MQLNV